MTISIGVRFRMRLGLRDTASWVVSSDLLTINFKGHALFFARRLRGGYVDMVVHSLVDWDLDLNGDFDRDFNWYFHGNLNLLFDNVRDFDGNLDRDNLRNGNGKLRRHRNLVGVPLFVLNLELVLILRDFLLLGGGHFNHDIRVMSILDSNASEFVLETLFVAAAVELDLSKSFSSELGIGLGIDLSDGG